jgi:hypothetical protein
MARSEAGRLLTIQHRQRQLQLRAATFQTLTQLWGLWDGQTIRTFPRFAEPATTLVQDRFGTSAGLAVGYYQALRLAESAGGSPTPRVADPPETDRVVGSLRATALASTLRGLRTGFSPQAAKQNALVAAMGSAGRMVMRGAAESLVLTAAADPRARGWQRVAGSGACDFCEMLAGRGPVYSEDTADFQSHDHCACSAEVVFR